MNILGFLYGHKLTTDSPLKDQFYFKYTNIEFYVVFLAGYMMCKW